MPPKASPTHFLCIPLASTQLTRSLASFRADVTSANSFAIPEQAVRPPGTLHLTLGVMSLKTNMNVGSSDTSEGSPCTVARAVEVLNGLRPRELLGQARASLAATTSEAAKSLGLAVPEAAAGPPPAGEEQGLTATLRGLHSMQTGSKAAVLYVPPADAAGVLRRFCEELQRPFIEAGLMGEENRPLLLHATVVNTIYVKGGGGGRGGRRGGRRERLTIDARGILERYEDYVWAESMALGRVAICRMGAKKVEGMGDEPEDAAYEVEAEIDI